MAKQSEPKRKLGVMGYWISPQPSRIQRRGILADLASYPVDEFGADDYSEESGS